MRRRMNRVNADHRFFRRTAVKSKLININPTVYRGGIRL